MKPSLKSLIHLMEAATTDGCFVETVRVALRLVDLRIEVDNLTSNSLNTAVTLLKELPEDTVLNREFWRGDLGQAIPGDHRSPFRRSYRQFPVFHSFGARPAGVSRGIQSRFRESD